MTIVLKMCLLLGVAAAFLIPSAFGLECVVCGSNGGAAGAAGIVDCAKYKPGDTSYGKKCSVPDGMGDKPLCHTTTVNNIEARGCGTTSLGKAGECDTKVAGGNSVKTCYCDDGDHCNKPTGGGGTGGGGGGGPGPGQQGSGSLNGPSFGMLGMVFLGGVGLIRGQLWG